MRTFGIVVGVNEPLGQTPLGNAENDAADVAAALRGESGPVAGADILDLIGAIATKEGLDEAFRVAALTRPDVLFVLLSGHGNTTGVCLHDGIYAFSKLSARINAVGARHAAVIVDTCHAGAFANHIGGIGGLPDESWEEAFRGTLPGVWLLLSSRADETSMDGPRRNGVFTEGLLLALRTLMGDLVVSGRSYISAGRAFDFAVAHVHKQTQGRQTPTAYGPSPVFPLALSRFQPARRPAPVVSPAPLARPRPAPAPAASGPGLGTAALFGLGLAWLATRPTYDPGSGRYRGGSGRFRKWWW